MSVLSAPSEFESKSVSNIDAVSSKVWVAVIIVIAALSIVLRFNSLNHSDNSWLLYAVGEYMRGSQLYVDLVEINPPLVFMLYFPPVWVANILSMEINSVFYTYVFVLASISCSLSYLLLDRIGSINRLIVVLFLLIALFVLPRGDFGQREHLMVIFSMPYVFLTIRRMEGMPSRFLFSSAIGLLAFFGFGLKPYFLLIPALLEVLLLYKSRNLKLVFRPETLVLGLSLLGYVVVIYFITPEYLTKILPIALEVYTQGYNAPVFRVVFRPELLMIIMLAGTGLLMFSGGNPVISSMMALLIAGVAAYAMYVVQMKGWSYQSYPALAFLSVASSVLVVEGSKQKCSQSMRFALIFISSVVILTLPISSLIDFNYKNPRVEVGKKVIMENQPTSSFLVLSSTLSAGFPLVTSEGLTWASRFPTYWMLPGIIQKRNIAAGNPQPKIDEIERYHMDAVVEDIMKFKPELVFVDVRPIKPQFGGLPFDFIDYFSKDTRFKTLWSKYEKIGSGRLGFEYYRLKN